MQRRRPERFDPVSPSDAKVVLEGRLAAALHPEVRIGASLQLVPNGLEHLDVPGAPGRLRIDKVRQEGDDAELLGRAAGDTLGLEQGLACQLGDLARTGKGSDKSRLDA